MNSNQPSLGQLLHEAARAVRRKFEESSAGLGLSTAQWRMLLLVCKKGSAAQSRFADLLEIEPITVSRLVDRMEEQGWVIREADPSDRRVKLVRPTEKALDAFSHFKSIADEVYAAALIGLTETQREDLMAALQTICSNLSKAETLGEKVSA